MAYDPYLNLLRKVKFLLKEDDNLTKGQSENNQWQLLAKVKDFTFYVGKGGVNTMFYSKSSTERAVCYPEEIIKILENAVKSSVFVYVAYDSNKEILGHSINFEDMINIEGARYVATIDKKGKRKLHMKYEKGLFGNSEWTTVKKSKK